MTERGVFHFKLVAFHFMAIQVIKNIDKKYISNLILKKHVNNFTENRKIVKKAYLVLYA